MRRLPTFLLGNEPDALLAATGCERDRVLVLLGLGMGLRVSELTKLRVEHIDLVRRILLVRDAKGKKDRALPIPGKVQAALERWLADRTEGFVFPSPRGGRLSVRAVQYLIKRLAVKAGLPRALEPRRATPHKLRHAFASRMLERGATIDAVKDALGHASIATTAVYLHTSPEHLRAGMEI